jgi:beta-glucosidase
MRRPAVLTLALTLLASAPLAAQGPADARVRDLLARMTIEEKFWQLFMIPGDLSDSTHDYSHGAFGLQTPGTGARAQATTINTIQRYLVEKTRLGIPMIPFEEAVHGLKSEGGTMFPAAIALAATWDTALMARVATAIAEETRSRGIRDVLSPVINIANDVRWGRVEETYGEDPVLTSQMARAFVAPFEKAGVVTTPKHFIANVGDGGRDSYPIDMDLRLLSEVFFPPFQAALNAGARSVMTSYNSVNGDPATQSRWFLTDILKTQWGFKGFVISDASATGGSTVLHHTEASTATATTDALNAGLDVIFESRWEQHRNYLAAFRSGAIPIAVIDSAVARVLRAKIQLGLFEHPYVNVDSAAMLNGSAAHRALALEAARASIVLLKNERNVLPLAKAIRSIAVIGPDATEARLGGYSGPGNNVVSILDGLKTKLGQDRVRYARGVSRADTSYAVIPAGQFTGGLRGEYFANNTLSGAPTVTRTDANIDFRWTLNSPARGLPFDWYSARWTGTLTVPQSGAKRIGVEGNDGYRLYLDSTLVIDNWKKQSYGTRFVDVTLSPGTPHDIRLEYFESSGNARLKLVWDAGVTNDWQSRIENAMATARASDAAVIVAGIEEGEFRDRAFLGLPGHQEDLINAVASTGKPVVIVLVGGSAITMSRWIDHVAGVLDVWYPGEAGGTAVADVLFGDANPAGRLPITFAMSEGQLPLTYNHKPTGRGDDYLDLTGMPLFPFGFGLSYTTFEYSALTINADTIRADGSATVRCYVTNTGTRAGDEVVQLYIHDVLASVAQPVIALKGFTRIHLEPGQGRQVFFTLSKAELQLLDRDMHWTVEPGVFRVLVGSSSKDVRLRGDLVVR